MKYLLTLATALLLFVACGSDDNSTTPSGPSTDTEAARAVMIYMAAENNLTVINIANNSGHRYLKEDLKEITEGSKSLASNQRVFIFVDSVVTDKTQKGLPYIAEVHGGKVTKLKEFDSDFYSCDPARFQEVVAWMTSNVKAKGYGLVLWGHADGWMVEDSVASSSLTSRRAYGLDTGKDTGGTSKWMNITQMAKALKTLPKLDFIFADCCNMMCAEVGYELRDVTSYLIGSPAEIPGPGAPYDKVLPLLFKNGSDLYRSIIDAYYAYYKDYLQNPPSGDSYAKGHSVPLAAIDTKYMADLATATRNVLDQFEGGYPVSPSSPDVSGIAYYWAYETPIMYDMRAVLKTHLPSSAFEQWDKVYQQAVPYYRMSMRWMTIYNGYPYYDLKGDFYSFNQDTDMYGCVSMFFPKNETQYTGGKYKYNITSNNFGWNHIIDWSRYGW